MCTRYYFEIVCSGQRSRAFKLATTAVQLIVRGNSREFKWALGLIESSSFSTPSVIMFKFLLSSVIL